MFLLLFSMIPLVHPEPINEGSNIHGKPLSTPVSQYGKNTRVPGLEIDGSRNYNYSTYILQNSTMNKGNLSIRQNLRQPYESAFDQFNGIVYVARYLSCEIMEVNVTTMNITGCISAYTDASNVVFCSSNRDLYVSSICADSISVINTSTNDLMKYIHIGVDPCCMLLDRQNGLLYTFNTQSYNISIINTTENMAQGQIRIGHEAVDGVLENNGMCMVVVTRGSQDICLINMKTCSTMGLYAIGDIKGITTDYSNGNVYISSLTGPKMYVVNSTTHLITNQSVRLSGEIQFCQKNGRIYISDAISNCFSYFNATTLEMGKKVHIFNFPYSFSFLSSLDKIFVNGFSSNSITILNFTSLDIEKTIHTSYTPSTIAYCKNNGEIYVAQCCNNSVLVLNDTNFHLIKEINVGAFQPYIAINPVNRNLYVLLKQRTKADVISTTNNTILYSVSVGCAPVLVSFDPLNGDSFIVNSLSDSVSEVGQNSHQTSRTYNTGKDPTSAVFSVYTCSLYVADSFGSNITVINITDNKTTQIPFFHPSSLQLSNNGILLYVSNSTNEMSVISLKNHHDRSAYSVSGTGYKLFKNVANGNIYYETFGDVVVVFRSGSQIPDCFIRIPSTGCMGFSISGQRITISLCSGGVIHIMNQKKEYDVRFLETGLPAGTGWYVNITDYRISSQSHSDTVSVPMIYGNYTYAYQSSNRIYNSSCFGTVEINSSSAVITLHFKPVYYHVKFLEDGLPSSGAWCIEVNGREISIQDQFKILNLTNGTYDAMASTSSPYYYSTFLSFYVNGRNVDVVAHFYEYRNTGNASFRTFLIIISGITLIAAGIYSSSRFRKH